LAIDTINTETGPPSSCLSYTDMLNSFQGATLSWQLTEAIVELALHQLPCNEIGSVTLRELEQFVECLQPEISRVQGLVIHSLLPSGFSAGADLRELYRGLRPLGPEERATGVRGFLERIHRVFNFIDGAPIVTVAAVHGVVFGGGFELALTCDLMVADRTARFCFPELRLGLIPGFGGIPRLKRDLGNALIRDLLFTGRSFNAKKAAEAGLVSQLVGEGQALRTARGIVAQVSKLDQATVRTAKQFIKPIPEQELKQEIAIFCELFNRPLVESALRRFVESSDLQPYLP
jgi:enoyl-CoA hydratase/carnithine racemase